MGDKIASQTTNGRGSTLGANHIHMCAIEAACINKMLELDGTFALTASKVQPVKSEEQVNHGR